MVSVLADKQRAVRVLLKITDNQRVVVEVLNLLFSQRSIRVSRIPCLEVHVSNKLPKLHRVGIVLLSVGIVLLGEPLLNDSARLKQTVGNNTGVALGTVLVLHGKRHERAVGDKTIHTGVGYGVCFIRRVGYADRLRAYYCRTSKSDTSGKQLLPAGEPDTDTAHDIAADHVDRGCLGYSADSERSGYAEY